MKQPTVIFIVGPTSSGKTAVASSLALAINCEIISSDSMQIYKNMDIITQTPSQTILAKVKHHLIQEISSEEEFSAAQFVEKAYS